MRFEVFSFGTIRIDGVTDTLRHVRKRRPDISEYRRLSRLCSWMGDRPDGDTEVRENAVNGQSQHSHDWPLLAI
jgi:hypothetical protein